MRTMVDVVVLASVWSVCVHATPPLPTTSNGFRFFYEGNSLTGPLMTDTQFASSNEPTIMGMAYRLGYRQNLAKMVNIAGTPVDYLWYTARPQIEQTLADYGPFELFVVQPFGHVVTRTVHVEGSAAAQIFRRVLAGNSNAAMLVYETWTDGTTYYNTNTHYFNDGAFAASISNAFESFLEPMVDVLRQEFPDNPVYAVPAGQAFVELYRRIQANGGNYAGFTNLAQIMGLDGNSVHPNRKGYYLAMMTHLSCYFQQTTATQGLPYAFNWYLAWETPGSQPTGLTSNEAQALQEIAWDVTRTFPRTPVTRGERSKTDAQRPSPPGALATNALTAKQVIVTWSAATDNVGVVFYSVYRNDEYIGDTTGLTFTAGHLLPGQTNVLRVRAWDAAWNFRDTAALSIAVPPQNGIELITWDTSDLTPTTGQTLTPARVHAAIQSAPATVVRGAGISDPQFAIRGLMSFSKCNHATLDAAVAATCYFGFTVVPTGTTPLVFDSLGVVVGWHLGTSKKIMKLALLSDRTGFAASNVLYTIALNGIFEDIEFPLRDMPPFQFITNAVEFRLYPYGANESYDIFYLGSLQLLHDSPTNEMRLLGRVVPEPCAGMLVVAAIMAAVRARRSWHPCGRGDHDCPAGAPAMKRRASPPSEV